MRSARAAAAVGGVSPLPAFKGGGTAWRRPRPGPPPAGSGVGVSQEKGARSAVVAAGEELLLKVTLRGYGRPASVSRSPLGIPGALLLFLFLISHSGNRSLCRVLGGAGDSGRRVTGVCPRQVCLLLSPLPGVRGWREAALTLGMRSALQHSPDTEPLS